MSTLVSCRSASRCTTLWSYALVATLLAMGVLPAWAVTIKNVPLTVNSVPGNLVLVPSFEYPTFIGHANDPGLTYSQGAVYSPTKNYSGYFNSSLCYGYQYDATEANRYFFPSSAEDTNGGCSGQTARASLSQPRSTPTQRLWSGNFLNWATMQAVDTYRLALTGGYRVNRPVEGTPPYSLNVIGSNLSSAPMTTQEKPDKTYLEKGNSDRLNGGDGGDNPLRSMAANDANVAGATASPSSAKGILTRIGGLRNQMWFIFDASKSVGNNSALALPIPVPDVNQSLEDGSNVTATVYNPTTTINSNRVYAVSVRVRVCDGALDTRDFCQSYGNYYKPEGLLQANPRNLRYSLFDYMVENGDTRRGGAMRARQKIIGPVSAAEVAGTELLYPDQARIAGIDNPEWDSATGVFLDNPDPVDASTTQGRVGACQSSDQNNCVIKFSGVINAINRTSQINTGYGSLKGYDNYAEMYYTALLYLRGLANNPAFSALAAASNANPSPAPTPYQNSDGLPVIEDWYQTGANQPVTPWSTTTGTRGTAADPMLYQCQTTALLGVGDTNTHPEYNLSGYTFDTATQATSPAARGDRYRSLTECGNTCTGAGSDGAGNLAGLAFWAHVNDIRSDIPNTPVAASTTSGMKGQTIGSFFVDVVEYSDLKNNNSNQFYNATKYGGYTIPDTDWQTTGNATAESSSWLGGATGGTANTTSWTSATQTINAASGLNNGNYFLPNNMYLGNDGQGMVNGLTSAFGRIAAGALSSGASLAASAAQLDPTNGAVTYQTAYQAGVWTGDLRAFSVSAAGVIGATPTWQASSLLPPSTATGALTATSRIIKTCNATCTGTGNLISFNTSAAATFTSQALAALGPDTSTQNNVINYLRGDATNEVRNGGTLRDRPTTVLGDIVNSQPVFVGTPNANLYSGGSFTGASTYSTFVSNNVSRAKRLYVASNDGMMHGFNADTGVETFAYMPNAVVVAGINNLSSKNYGTNAAPHQFYNDGELTVTDAYLNGFDNCSGATCWRTVLVGTSGRGPSKAIYALDVTIPSSPKLLWERDSTDDPNIGSVIGKPVIAQTADGNWSVLLGNGYNSVNNKPALLQISLNVNPGTVTSYTTSGSTDDGLAQPAVWIANLAQNLSTQAYAGDLHGNVWKFDLTGASNAGTLLYVVKDANRKVQPISTGMIAGRNPKRTDASELWVFFGTGEALAYFLKPTDQTAQNSNVQTWYGLIVQGANTVVSGDTRAMLMQRTITSETAATATLPSARTISTATAGDMVGKKGWYIDLLSPATNPAQAQGERFLTPNQFQGQLLLGTTRLPSASSNPCNPAGAGWIMAINPFTGVPPQSNFFDANLDGSINASDNTNGAVTAGLGFGSLPSNPIFISNRMLVNLDNASSRSILTATGTGNISRLSWRELIVQ